MSAKSAGISFEQAVDAFDDPYALIAGGDSARASGKIRQSLIGEAQLGVLVVTFTLKADGTDIHLVEARKANAQERSLYEVFKGIPLP